MEFRKYFYTGIPPMKAVEDHAWEKELDMEVNEWCKFQGCRIEVTKIWQKRVLKLNRYFMETIYFYEVLD